MRRSFCLGLLASLGSLCLAGCLPLDGHAQRSFTTTEAKPSSLLIESRFLDVDVSVATGKEVTIEATIDLRTSGGDETAEREIEKCMVHVERDGDKLIVRQGKRNEQLGVSSWSGSGHIKLALPADVPFRIATASGDVRLQGDFGAVDANVSVASGDISGTFGAKAVTIKSASGDTKVVMQRPLDALECASASGDVEISGPSIAAGSFSTASGDLTVAGLVGGTKASTASGSIRLVFIEFPASAATMAETASGNIHIALPRGAQPSGSVSTASGDITLDVPGKVTKRGATFAGQGAKMQISTASGDVRVTTAKEAATH
jgi:hypothetical protein